MKGTYLGEFEELVLLTVGILFDDAYGLAIVDELEKQTERTVLMSSVHKALVRLEEKGYPTVYYLPRNDTDMSLLVRTTHYSYCPYKGDCTYYSIPIGGSKSEYAVWTYEKPYEAVASIKEYLAFYPSRVDAIEVIS